MSDCGSVALCEQASAHNTVDPLASPIYATNQSQPIERYTQAQNHSAVTKGGANTKAARNN
jgi:hypothetical protein